MPDSSIEAARGVRLALSSCPDRASAERLAEQLLAQRLAACVSLLPGATSIYRWQGQLERSEEVLLLIKTQADCIDELLRVLPAAHPYELPELLVVDVASGLPAYLDWVVAQTRPTPTPTGDDASRA